nr:immunoglobulin heavy chain junction region [Mus musculus]MBK4184446.1 immunoglobulin heavy chain junction region [Mus musculus]MBK4184447.1 immunoglobulin heavy chain junction region [Mus musculus]MBK4184448.1 immunoglobulin heavy chain junction region [Mus musculus]MBK4184451.1 immunoglobulin heavy chain junction region [Mus musculus]
CARGYYGYDGVDYW